MWKLAFSHVDFCFHCLTCSIPVVRKHFQSEWKTVMIIFGSTVFSKKGKSFCGPILILIFLLQNTVTCFKAYEHNYNTFNVLYWIYFLSVLYSLSIGFLTCRLHFLPLLYLSGCNGPLGLFHSYLVVLSVKLTFNPIPAEPGFILFLETV